MSKKYIVNVTIDSTIEADDEREAAKKARLLLQQGFYSIEVTQADH